MKDDAGSVSECRRGAGSASARGHAMTSDRVWYLPALAAALAMSVLVSAASAEPKFELVGSEIALLPGATQGTGTLILQASGLEGPEVSAPLVGVVDLKTPDPPDVAVTFDEPLELDRTAAGRRWLLMGTVAGLTAIGSQKRYVSFTLGPATRTLPYTLNNLGGAAFQWTVSGPSGEVSLRPGQGLEIGVSVEGLPATNVGLVQASLIEQSSKTTLRDGWVLCDPAGPCEPGKAITFQANSANRLWLRPAGGESLVGKYVGTVIIGASQDPPGKTLSLTVYGTSPWHQIAGVLVILAGVGLAWMTSVLIQARLNRAQMLLPATAMRERVTDLRTRLEALADGIRANAGNTDAALRALEALLTPAGLEKQGLLPPKVPTPSTSAGDMAERYKAAMKRVGDHVGALDVLIEGGFEPLARMTARSGKPLPDADADAAVAALDGQARSRVLETDPVPTPDLTNAIRAALDAYKQTIPPAMTRESVPTPQIAPPSFAEVRLEIATLSVVFWIVFGLLSTVLGAYVLILGNPGFGLAGDFVVCLFWGFGLPVAGQQLAQSNIGSVKSALGIPVPS